MLRWIWTMALVSLTNFPAFAGQLTIGSKRPATLLLPDGVRPDKPLPLLLYLHGYGGYAAVSDNWIGASREALAMGYAVLLPEGKTDFMGRRFWHATPGCCDFLRTGVDDVAYLFHLVLESQRVVMIDPTKIYIMGHSNGGFMAYRIACEHPDLVRGIIVIAGASFRDPSRCRLPQALNALHIHGMEDSVIPYAGDWRFPGAQDSIAQRVRSAKCKRHHSEPLARESVGSPYVPPPGSPPTDTSRLDVLDPDTDVDEWSLCEEDSRIGLWTIRGSSHRPDFHGSTIRDALQFVR
jgi:polyhydroxybutyrate depolymerase